VTTLSAQPRAEFHQRLKEYLPPPELKIAAGDTLSVVIWESAANGLFGNSLTELSFAAGASARLLTGQQPSRLGGVPSLSQELAASPETLRQLFGAAAGLGAAAAAGGLAGAPDQAGLLAPLAAAPGYDVLSTGAGSVTIGGLAPPTPTGGILALPSPTGGADPGAAAAASPAPRPAGGAATQREQRLEQLLEAAAQSGRPGTRIPDQPVASDGKITIPYAGRLAVAGRTAQEVEQAVQAALAGKALDPQALVVVKRSAANSVSVTGEGVGGTRVPLSPGGDRLLQVIAAAGGAKTPLHDTFVRLSRDGVTATVPLATLVANPDQDIFAQPGDVLTLVRRPQTFSVFGATGKNAAITFNSERLSLNEALAKAGGLLNDRADARAVFLFRYEPVGIVKALGQPIATGAPPGLSPIAYRLDLREAESFALAGRFPVRDKDVIFVANAESVPIQRFFSLLGQLTGPIQTGVVVCSNIKC
jgi:polysaccharide export outer membrane protein